MTSSVPGPVDLNACVKVLVSTFRTVAGTEVDLFTRLQEPLPAVHVDPTSLGRALLSLLLDVTEARERRAVILSTSDTRSRPPSDGPREGHWVLLELEDPARPSSEPGEDPGCSEATSRRLARAAREGGGGVRIRRGASGELSIQIWLQISSQARAPRGFEASPPAAGAEVEVLLFEPFQLDLTNETLRRDGRELPLRSMPFRVLRYLAEHPHRLVTQRELIDNIWGTIATSRGLLRTHIHELRQVLGQGIIETVSGRGYRFLPAVMRGTVAVTAP